MAPVYPPADPGGGATWHPPTNPPGAPLPSGGGCVVTGTGATPPPTVAPQTNGLVVRWER